jgi:two-component system, chemotaxis family, protein-glutamate methylesterase/glutaminase
VARDIVVIGVSAGGLDAVCAILGELPPQLAFAFIIVQHRSKDSTALCEVLERCSRVPVHEAADKDRIEVGHAYLAPADYHLFVDDGHFALSVDAPEFYSRPSIDLAFESIADYYGSRAIGVVMTGANRDGSRGLRYLAERGGIPLVQDPADANVATMPAEALKAVPEAEVVTLATITRRLCELTGTHAAAGT